jgi:hypothetical protein
MNDFAAKVRTAIAAPEIGRMIVGRWCVLVHCLNIAHMNTRKEMNMITSNASLFIHAFPAFQFGDALLKHFSF